jgi:hypothetical protein
MRKRRVLWRREPVGKTRIELNGYVGTERMGHARSMALTVKKIAALTPDHLKRTGSPHIALETVQWTEAGISSVVGISRYESPKMLNSDQPRNQHPAMTDDSITISPGTRFRVALMLAVVADVLQVIFLPLFVEGVESPADDVLDLGVGAALVYLLGWHWEFLPSFLGKLAPGVDLVPFWTLAVANVYRKSKRALVPAESRQEP